MLYMFRMPFASIVRSTINCNSSTVLFHGQNGTQSHFGHGIVQCARPSHLYRIYSNSTYDKHQWLLLQFIVLLKMDAKGVQNMYSILVVFNKHNTARVASCWFIIYYRLVLQHGNSNIKKYIMWTDSFVIVGFRLPWGSHPKNCSSFPGRNKGLSFRQCIQIGSWDSSSLICNGSWDKAAGAWSWPLTLLLIWRMSGSVYPIPHIASGLHRTTLLPSVWHYICSVMYLDHLDYLSGAHKHSPSQTENLLLVVIMLVNTGRGGESIEVDVCKMDCIGLIDWDMGLLGAQCSAGLNITAVHCRRLRFLR